MTPKVLDRRWSGISFSSQNIISFKSWKSAEISSTGISFPSQTREYLSQVKISYPPKVGSRQKFLPRNIFPKSKYHILQKLEVGRNFFHGTSKRPNMLHPKRGKNAVRELPSKGASENQDSKYGDL